MNEKAQLIQRQLESPDCEMRIAATKLLSSLPVPSMELFTVCLGDSDWRVRKVAVETFYSLDFPEKFIPDLIKLLHHSENAGLRNAAIEILIWLGSHAVTDLQHEILKPDVEVRKFVIDILGEIGDFRCAPALISSLEDADINVRYAAVETLGKLRFEAAVEPLLELMSDPDPGLKFTILQALGQIGGAIPTDRLFLYLDDRLLRKALFDCFAEIGGPEVIPSLVGGLTDPMRQVRDAALCALDRLRSQEISTIKDTLAVVDVDPIASSLEQIISGDKPHLKEAAIALYGTVASQRDLSQLLNCMSEEGLQSQTLNAFAALGEGPFARLINTFDAPDLFQTLNLVFIGGELGFSQALSLSIEAASSVDPQLRHAASKALGVLGGEEQLEPLMRFLDDQVVEIQDAAAISIAIFAKRHKNIVLSHVSPLLVNNEVSKRMRGVRILGLIDDESIETLLLKAFKDSSASVRCEAIRALSGHRTKIVISGLTLALTDESAEVRRLAVGALGLCPQNMVFPTLALAAADADIWVRSAVMRTLESFSGDDVSSLLAQGLADPVGLVVIAALESSLVVMPEQCQSFLENALAHPDAEVVKVAINLLSRFDGKDWIGVFGSALLNHSHWDVRLHAVRSLAQSHLNEAPELFEERLAVETEGLVRQAIESVMSGWLRTDSQDG